MTIHFESSAKELCKYKRGNLADRAFSWKKLGVAPSSPTTEF